MNMNEHKPDDPIEELETEEVTLERMRLHLTRTIGKQLAKHYAMEATIHCEDSDALDAFIFHIIQPMFGETLKRIEVSYPSDWWQAFKERWFPEWAKERWPVEYRDVELRADAVYPEISVPDERHYVRLRKIHWGWREGRQ